jgi:hypothetical protein
LLALLLLLIDIHQDAIGTALCGEGVPMWLSQLATPDLIGRPLQGLTQPELATHTVFTPAFINITADSDSPTDPTGPGGWPMQPDGSCGPSHLTTGIGWAAHAGSAEYNMLNPCCAKLNGRDTSINAPHWADLLLTVNANRTMEYLLRDPEGKGHYAAFTALLATAVAKHPAAIGIELSEYTHRHTDGATAAAVLLGLD